MSYWTYINGTITVTPLGRTQPEKRYILDTVIDHLPKVTGSEEDMHVHVIQKCGCDWSSNCNEFGERWSQHFKLEVQNHYILVLEAALRGREFSETLRELNKWLNRLAKRVYVTDILVRIGHQYDHNLIISNPEPYGQMFELPSWHQENQEFECKPAWAEYLMWESAKDSFYPMKLTYKYYNDPENDAEYLRREKYLEGEWSHEQ